MNAGVQRKNVTRVGWTWSFPTILTGERGGEERQGKINDFLKGSEWEREKGHLRKNKRLSAMMNRPLGELIGDVIVFVPRCQFRFDAVFSLVMR